MSGDSIVHDGMAWEPVVTGYRNGGGISSLDEQSQQHGRGDLVGALTPSKYMNVFPTILGEVVAFVAVWT